MGRKRKDEVLQAAIDNKRSIYPDLSDKTAHFHIVGWKPKEPKPFVLQTRYECWTMEGKTWCRWYNLCEGDTEKELKEKMKEYKKMSVNGKVHLKDDFQIIPNPKFV